MRLHIAVITTLLFLATFGTQVVAQELTLDDCIELALQNRASIIMARGAEAQAAAGKRAALGAFLPRLNASYNYNKGKETDIDPQNPLAFTHTEIDSITLGGVTAYDAVQRIDSVLYFDEQDTGPNRSLSLSANVELVNFSNIFGYSAARSQHEAAKLDVLASESDLIYVVKVAYYAYLAAIENVSVQEDGVRRAEEQFKLIESRYELGSASKSDVLKQKVQFGNERLGLLRAQNLASTTHTGLAYTIGLDPQQEHVFNSKYTVREYTGTLGEAMNFGMINNPSLMSSEKSVDQWKRSVRAARAGYLPTLSLWADYTQFEGTQAFPFAFDFAKTSKTYGFRFSWNIFDGFQREQRVTNNKVYRNNAMAAAADKRNLMVRDIKTAYLDTERLIEQKLVSAENVEAAEEDLRITREKYNLGAATILDLLESQVSLKSAQVSLIQADFDMNLAVSKLENAMGKR